MTKLIPRSRTETFGHTVAGLLTKRSNLSAEATELRDRLSEIRIDLEALDRVLPGIHLQQTPHPNAPCPADASPKPKRS